MLSFYNYSGTPRAIMCNKRNVEVLLRDGGGWCREKLDERNVRGIECA